jgi:hypothetical protein
MTLKNLTDLANKLKRLKHQAPGAKLGFDMRDTYHSMHYTNHPCGSACCIGGWVQFLNEDTRDVELEMAVMTICPPEVTFQEVYKLCYPPDETPDAWHATPQQAARAVEILRDTGKCDWDRAMLEGAESDK